ncbi:hypothetical protein F503_01721 [Ophiostoma piceae UAMH 11346]|uniref:Uncharacterized protein n=1 Tax=Ophiostoma piceae (strain UAMH 11346) TaxID=1262450 RepID=S3BWN0_OPHP1|nr:hypothetical protein F503_01721 [Ophiostoma piceae UAMH 11346]
MNNRLPTRSPRLRTTAISEPKDEPPEEAPLLNPASLVVDDGDGDGGEDGDGDAEDKTVQLVVEQTHVASLSVATVELMLLEYADKYVDVRAGTLAWTICRSKDRPRGMHWVPGARAMVLDQKPAAQRCQQVERQFHSPLSPSGQAEPGAITGGNTGVGASDGTTADDAETADAVDADCPKTGIAMAMSTSGSILTVEIKVY